LSFPITDSSLDYVLSNRDWMGMEMKRCLTSLKLSAQSKNNKAQTEEFKELR